MLATTDDHLPMQLIQILTKINENISDVKERVIRIEAQDYQLDIRELKQGLEQARKEREEGLDTARKERRELEKQLNDLKNRLAPLLAGATLLVSVATGFVLKAFHL